MLSAVLSDLQRETKDERDDMSETTWTWVLLGMEFLGVFGMWNVGNRKWWGWALVLVHSFPWLAYSIIFNKPGFVAMSFLWISMHLRNTVKWFREQRHT